MVMSRCSSMNEYHIMKQDAVREHITADFIPVSPSGELDEIHTSSLFLDYSLYYMKTQNRKYITYRTAIRGQSSRGYM